MNPACPQLGPTFGNQSPGLRGAYPDSAARASAGVAGGPPVVVSHGFQDDPTFYGGSSPSSHPFGQLAVPKRQSCLSSEDDVYHIKDFFKVEVGKLPSSASEFLDWGMCLTTSMGSIDTIATDLIAGWLQVCLRPTGCCQDVLAASGFRGAQSPG